MSDKARSAFMKACELDSDPSLDTRSLDTPMGLKVRKLYAIMSMD